LNAGKRVSIGGSRQNSVINGDADDEFEEESEEESDGEDTPEKREKKMQKEVSIENNPHFYETWLCCVGQAARKQIEKLQEQGGQC